jgi:hypothetical protein
MSTRVANEPYKSTRHSLNVVIMQSYCGKMRTCVCMAVWCMVSRSSPLYGGSSHLFASGQRPVDFFVKSVAARSGSLAEECAFLVLTIFYAFARKRMSPLLITSSSFSGLRSLTLYKTHLHSRPVCLIPRPTGYPIIEAQLSII